MRDDAVVGVTTNPTIFQKAIAEGEAYDDQLLELLEEEADPKGSPSLSARDRRWRARALAPVHEAHPQDGLSSGRSIRLA